MVGKIGVVYAAGSADPVTLDAVDQIEDLTTGLSRKVWQKLALLNEIAGPQAVPPASAAS